MREGKGGEFGISIVHRDCLETDFHSLIIEVELQQRRCVVALEIDLDDPTTA
jgi:hypothetical protein